MNFNQVDEVNSVSPALKPTPPQDSSDCSPLYSDADWFVAQNDEETSPNRISRVSSVDVISKVDSIQRLGDLTRISSTGRMRSFRRRAVRPLISVLQVNEKEIRNLETFVVTGVQRSPIPSFSNLIAIYAQRNVIDSLEAILPCSNSLRILNVSSNALNKLPSSEFWSAFTKLLVLDVSNNQISKWSQLQGIQQCKTLVLFRIMGNPIATKPTCRAVIVNQMPFLIAVDDHIVADEERIKNANFGPRYCANHNNMALTVWIPWKEYPPATSNEELIPALARTLFTLKRLTERNSPVIQIQRIIRGHLSRQHRMRPFPVVKAAAYLIQRVFRGGWLRRYLWHQLRQVLVVHHKEILLIPTAQMQQYRAAPRIMAIWMARRSHVVAKRSINFVKSWLRAVVANTKEVSSRLVTSNHLRIYFHRDDMDTIFHAVSLVCKRRDSRLLEYSDEDLRARMLPSGVSVIRNATYNYRYFHRTAWMQRDVIKCDGIFKRFHGETKKNQAAIWSMECEILEKDEARLVASISQHPDDSHLRGLLSDAQRRVVQSKSNSMLEQQRIKYLERHRHTANISERQLPIKPRGKPKSTLKPKIIKPWQEYQQLYVFIPTSISMYRRVIYAIRHRHRYNSLRVYTPRDVEHICSAVIIQSAYRSYITRRDSNFAWKFVTRRAIVCIQRWWRIRSYLCRRLELLTACVRMLASIDSNVLYIEERTLMTIKHPSLVQRIMANAPPLPSHDWKFKFSSRQVRLPITLEESLARLPEDEKQAYLSTFLVDSGIQRVGFPVWMPSIPLHETVGREEKQTSKENVALLLSTYVNETIVTEEIQRPQEHVDINDAAMCRFTACRNVIRDSQILRTDGSEENMNWYMAYGITLVRMEFDSIQEARHRAMLLLMKTYDSQHKTYARLYTYSMLRYLWLSKPISARLCHVFSEDWKELRMDIPNRWGGSSDTYNHTDGEMHRLPLARNNGLATVLGSTEDFSPSDITAPTSHRSELLDPSEAESIKSPTVSLLVEHLRVQSDFDPSYELHLLKLQQAENIRMETEAIESRRKHIRHANLRVKQAHVAQQQLIPQRPIMTPNTTTRRNRAARFQDKVKALENAIEADQVNEIRAANILHRMRLAERARKAVTVERKLNARENAAKIASHKISIDAQLQRTAYEQAQVLLVKQQRKAVEAAISSRKKAQRQFAKHFGQKAVSMMRCNARDREQDRAAAHFQEPIERFKSAKLEEIKTEERIRGKLGDILLANQQNRIVQSMEIQYALDQQEEQEFRRLEDIQARIAQERKVKELMQTSTEI